MWEKYGKRAIISRDKGKSNINGESRSLTIYSESKRDIPVDPTSLARFQPARLLSLNPDAGQLSCALPSLEDDGEHPGWYFAVGVTCVPRLATDTFGALPYVFTSAGLISPTS